MMSLSGFDAPGRWLRGNLHCHSTLSDGTRSPQDVASAYRRRGYDFLAITDHYEERWGWSITEPNELGADPILLRSAELSSSDWADPDVYWVAAIGLPAGPHVLPRTRGHDVIKAAHRAGAFVGLLHPRLSEVTDAQALGLAHVHAVEVFNQSEICWDDRPDGWPTCEALLGAGCRVTGFAADDNHFDQPWEGFGARVQVRAQPDAASIVDALKAGDYYSTQGPLIHRLEMRDGAITVEADSARAIIAQGDDWRATARRSGEGITAAHFDLEPYSRAYVRFTVIDDKGQHAWTNPYWVGDR